MIVIALVVIAALIFAFTRSDNSSNSSSRNSEACDADVFECSNGSFVSRDPNNNCEFRSCPAGAIGGTQVYDITVTDNGLSPNTLTVPAGSLVRFTNQRSVPIWVASDVHPTHRAYPGSDISKCGTDEQIFDACSEFNQRDIYSFVFNEAGTWEYHDHLHPSMKGTIIVQKA